MSTERNNPEQILDLAIAEIRAGEMEPAAVRQAAERVWAMVAQGLPALRACVDFQALLPAYIAKQLPEARIWLLEDHLHGCPTCRSALETARSGKAVAIASRAATRRAAAPQWKWAMAATLAMGAGIGAWQARDNLLPAPGGPRGVVQSVSGALYRVSDTGSVPLLSGAELTEREEIRTARGAGAMVRLADGSLVEMRERSDLSLSRKRSGTTIRLERGSVIVQAARQRTGRLYVATNDCLVSVKGTVFAVDSGVKGSRVAVIQGEVRVEQAREARLLYPGQQTSTDAAMAPLPIKDEIAWSRNLNQHLALLGEFAAMQKQLEQTPGPGLRYSSRLLDLTPDGTVLYVAIPNIGGILGDAQRIFEDRLSQSAALREWWDSTGHSQQLNQALDTVRGFSGYLGDEVVFTVGQNGAGQYDAPLVMAEVTRSGFREYLEQQIGRIPGEASLTVADNPAALPLAGARNGAFALLMNGVVAVSPNPANLRAMAALMRQPASGAFAKTAFHQRVADSYSAGAGWLVCADMEQILARSVKDSKRGDGAVFDRLGVYDVQHLIVERKETGGKTENRAVVTFDQPRRGVAAWLGAPAPMGAVDFVSPDASFAVAFVMKQPAAALQELFNAVESVNPNFAAEEAQFESQTGISVRNDLAAPLGGDVAFALDGPLLPLPSWKFAVEVNDPARLQQTIQTLIAKGNGAQHDFTLSLTPSEAGGSTYYAVASSRSPITVYYTYADGYLVAAASQALLMQAIGQRAAGFTLTRSAGFKALLAPDGYSNLSAILYENLASVLGPLAGGLRSTGILTPEQQKSIDTLQANSAPALIYAYGGPDRIELTSTGSLFGFNLDALAGGGSPFRIPSVLEKAMQPHAAQ